MLTILLGSVLFVQTGGLEVKNLHATWGLRGSTRTDLKYVLGDAVTVTFDVQGLSLDKEGKYQASGRYVVEDSAGKVIYSDTLGDTGIRNGAVGKGKSRFSFRYMPEVGAGSYTLKVIITDMIPTQRQEASSSMKFEIITNQFAFIRTRLTRDPVGTMETMPVGAMGEVFYVHTMLTGMGKAGISVDVTLEIRDEKANIIGTPLTTAFKDLPGTDLPLRFEFPLDKTGKYTLQFTAVERGSNKKSQFSLPVTVVEVP